MEEFIGGVILFDETIRQRADDGTPFAELLASEGRRAGDQGRHRRAAAGRRARRDGHRGPRRPPRSGSPSTTSWAPGSRSGGQRCPSATACRAATASGSNAQALARYAALCQEAGIVPIVEPEVLMDTDHSIDACYDATARTLQALYAELAVQRVDLEGTLLKPNMVIPGKGNADQASPERIASATLDCFRRHVPAVVPGIVFLSGRPVRGGGDRQPRRDQPARRARLAALVLVRPGAAGVGAAGVARRRGERGGGAGRVPPPGAVQRSRRRRAVRRRSSKRRDGRTGNACRAAASPSRQRACRFFP